MSIRSHGRHSSRRRAEEPNDSHRSIPGRVRAEGKSAAAAYQEAGYHPHNGNAYALRHREDVSARINELLAERQAQNAEDRARAVEEAQISASRLAAQFARAYEIAEAAKKPEAMVNATVAQAKFAGLWVERSEITQVNEFAGLSLEEMRRELVERARRLGLDRHLAGLLEAPKDQGDGQHQGDDGDSLN